MTRRPVRTAPWCRDCGQPHPTVRAAVACDLRHNGEDATRLRLILTGLTPAQVDELVREAAP